MPVRSAGHAIAASHRFFTSTAKLWLMLETLDVSDTQN